MSQPLDPKRWKDGAGDAPPRFAEHLAADAADGPEAGTLARMLSRVALELGRPELQAELARPRFEPRPSAADAPSATPASAGSGAVASGASGAVASTGGAALKLGAGLLAVALGAGAYLTLWPESPSSLPVSTGTTRAPDRSATSSVGAPGSSATSAPPSNVAPSSLRPLSTPTAAPAAVGEASPGATSPGGRAPGASRIASPRRAQPAGAGPSRTAFTEAGAHTRARSSATPPATQSASAAAAVAPNPSRAHRDGDPRPTDPAAELALLERAQRSLATDPRLALSLADQHRRDFARGAFAQEREILAIDALVRLGERSAAERRARSFVRAFPASSHRTRLQDLLRSAP